ncbi:MAG: AAA family ATPase [Sphingomicrobium sp.]
MALHDEKGAAPWNSAALTGEVIQEGFSHTQSERSGQLPLQWIQAPRWHGFKIWPDPDRPGKLKKLPVNLNGVAIDATNPVNLSTYEDALAALHAGKYRCLGFALGPDDTGNYWQGIDLDDIEENGLQGLDHLLTGYKELSPSGKGVHAIGYGPAFSAFKHSGIEAYCEKRSFVVTGDVIQAGAIGDLSETVATHIEPLRPKREEAERPAQPDTEPTQSDEAITAFILRDPALAALYGGDLSAYGGDHSRADLSLCNAIAVRSRDRAQTERIWLASPMANFPGRAKKMARADYRQRTIEMAFDFKPGPEAGDFSNLKHNGERVKFGAAEQPKGSTDYSNQPTYADASTWDDSEPEPRLWVGDGIFPKGHVTLVVSHGGGFKTLGLQQLGTCAVTNKKFLGKYIAQGTVATYNCEDDLTESRRRQVIINRHYKAKPGPGRMHFHSLVGYAGNELVTWGNDGLMRPTQTFHNLRNDLLYHKPDIANLDNLTHFFGGNENIRSHSAGFCSLLEGLAAETGAAIIIIAHYNKDGKISGSSGWLNHVRHVVEFREVPNQPDKRQIWIEKSNYGPSKFVWAEFRYYNGVLVRDEDLPPDVAAHLAEAERARSDERLFLNCLAERTRQERSVSEHPSANYAPTVFADMSESERIGKRRLTLAMDRLFKAGTIKRAILWRDKAKGRDVVGLKAVLSDPQTPPPNGSQTLFPDAPELDAQTPQTDPQTPPYIIDIGGAAPRGSDAPPPEEGGAPWPDLRQ